MCACVCCVCVCVSACMPHCACSTVPFPLFYRSPSPEPIYSTDGKRLNTREIRVRKKLEDERHELVQEMLTINKEYKPPADYK